MSSKSKTKLTSLEALAEAAECLKTLDQPHRLRIMQLMLQENILWVNLPKLVKFLAIWLQNICGLCNDVVF